MLPTKGYFQDIECPFYNTTCGRPYCHFRHKRKLNENIDDNVQDTSKNVVPTYKPTPKSELANIHNSKSHIPISYVPDLAFNRERTIRPIRIDKPTYNPTPLSILSSANKPDSTVPVNEEHQETIKDIQENIASNIYDPSKSEINFEDLSNEFELIDDIINDSSKAAPDAINDNLLKLHNDIEKEQNRLNVLQSEIEFSTDETEQSNKAKELDEKKEDLLVDIKKEKFDKKGSDKVKNESKSVHKDRPKSSDKIKSKSRPSSKEKSSKEKDLKKGESSKSHKSSEREKHRKEVKKNSSKESESSKAKHISKQKIRNRSGSPKEQKTNKSLSKNRNKSHSNSSSSDNSPEPHRKEKKSDSYKSKKPKSREKSRSRNEKKEQKSKSRSTSKEKPEKSKHKKISHYKNEDRKEGKNKAIKEGEKHKDKYKFKSSSSSTSKKTDSTKKERRHKYTSESNYSTSDNDHDQFPMESDVHPDDLVLSDVDFDIDDEDETMRECYKIFSEYKPEPIKPKERIEEVLKKDLVEDDNVFQGKKRTAHAGADITKTYSKLPSIPPPKTTLLPGQILTNRYKIAKMAQANNEQENIMNEIKNITQQTLKRPATSLLEAARMHKIKRLQKQRASEAAKANVNIVEDILNGVHKPSPSQIKIPSKKIAAVPNVALIEKAKERISLVKQQRLQNVKTVAHTQKGSRVAHVPEYSLSDIPDVLQADKSKLAVNVRTRFLTMIVEECAKLYALKEDAYNRALNEEFVCYEKCKVLATYRNSAMLAVNRLRKELQDRESKGLGPLLSGESPTNKKETDFEGKTFYNHMKRWILTEDELNIHGYPRESGERGKAIINNRIEIDYSIVDENQRRCSRCGKMYQVDDDGWPLLDEECMYHPLKKRTIRGEQIFLCCKTSDDTGCVTSDTHVYDGSQTHLLEGYQTTLPPESDDDARSLQVYALDCEMCYTTKGLELTRVTIVDTDCKTIYESFVKPLNPIIDYNTRFSGITKDQMDRTSTSILQVQANILHLCNSETILVGHSLESDMKALKIVHSTVIDTSVLFPHKMGLPHKKALRVLASEHLKKIIQNDVGGHDSAEDAVTCMDLIKWKLKEELKTRTK